MYLEKQIQELGVAREKGWCLLRKQEIFEWQRTEDMEEQRLWVVN